MDTVHYHRLCRTCAGESTDVTSITSNLFIEERVVTLAEILEPFIDKPKINFPSVVCNLCVEKAISIHNFKTLCDKSTIFFENCLKNDKGNQIPYVTDSKGNDTEHPYTRPVVANEQVEPCKVELEDIAKPTTSADNIAPDFGDSVHNENSDCKNKPFNNNNNKNYYDGMARNEHSPIPDNKLSKCNAETVILGKSSITPKIKKIVSKTKIHRRKVESSIAPKIKKTISKVKIHRRKTQTIRNEEELFFCAECNKSFKSKYILISHVRRHRNKGKFLCTVCGKGFNAQSCLSRHARVHTGEKNYECEICHKKFPSSNNLKLHSRRHSGVKPYLCTLCGKCFSHPTGLTYHNRTHTNERPYACDVCDRRFTIQCHWERHRKTHSGERPFACDMCDKAFIKKFDLQRHQDVHLGNKPYVCSICKKAFVRKMHLDYHTMVHTKERPHVCTYCGKGFIRRYYLTSHVKKHHSLDFNEDTNFRNVDINDCC